MSAALRSAKACLDMWSGTLIVWLAFGVFFIAQVYFMSMNPWFWWDELWTLWASDPRVPFGTAFAGRMLADASPPLHPILLYGTRLLIDEPRLAMTTLNSVAVGIASVASFSIFRRAGERQLATVAAALIFLCGPVMAYVEEGRTYVMAMAALYIVASVCLAALRSASPVRDYVITAVAAAAATFSHIYGALFAGCIGTVWLAYGLWSRRVPIVRIGAVTAGAAILAFSVWLVASLPYIKAHAGGNFWIKFDWETVLISLRMAGGIVFGPPVFAFFAVALFGLLEIEKAGRTSGTLLIATAVLFFAIPTIVSFHTPIFYGRYFLVGGPALLLMLAVEMRDGLRSLLARPITLYARGLIAATALFWALQVAHSFWAGERFTATKKPWMGQLLVSRYLGDCPARVLRARVEDPTDMLKEGFDYLMERIGRTDVAIIDATKAPEADVSEINCAVVAWGEDWELGPNAVNRDMSSLMAAMRLTNRGALRLDLVRGRHSFILIKRKLP